MAGFFNFLGSKSDDGSSELPDIFPLSLKLDVFTKSDIIATYVKILTDTLERTHGLKDSLSPVLWDNCVQTNANKGLVTLLACAMTERSDLFLVFSPSTNILRRATYTEQEAIRKDYEKTGESKLGVFISFKDYRRTEMLTIYSALEYCVLASLHKTLNLSKAVQIKISELRASVSLKDESVGRAQAASLAKALAAGKDIFLDAKDEITTATPDTSSTEKAIGFLDSKRAFLLGLPISYITGLQTAGMNSTGGADTKAVERGLKQYFVSIIQPTLKALFGADTEFKSDDFEGMTSALEALKTFDLVTNDFMSSDAKKEVVARLFDLDPKEEEKALAADQEELDANPPPVVPPTTFDFPTPKVEATANA